MLSLKKQHAHKMVTFRQVIHLQQTELSQGKSHAENVVKVSDLNYVCISVGCYGLFLSAYVNAYLFV